LGYSESGLDTTQQNGGARSLLRGGSAMSFRAVSAMIVTAMLAGAAQAEQPLVEDGSYEVTFRLELPHLERWAIEKTRTVCLSSVKRIAPIPFPLMSDNNPFLKCRAENIRRDGEGVRYDVVCEGRDAAKAKAAYVLTPRAFSGRIAMVMGAKNMTMTEVQTGRRTGSCDLASMRQE
jgi:hypothetical protein